DAVVIFRQRNLADRLIDRNLSPEGCERLDIVEGCPFFPLGRKGPDQGLSELRVLQWQLAPFLLNLCQHLRQGTSYGGAAAIERRYVVFQGLFQSLQDWIDDLVELLSIGSS